MRAMVFHPASPPTAALDVAVSVKREAGGWIFCYRIIGEVNAVKLPEPAAGQADHLWMHTCCEAFASEDGAIGYREFNFSPSGQWAAYAFCSYRERLAWRLPRDEPTLTCERTGDAIELTARVGAAWVPSAPRFGLTAVLETLDGKRSYWALAHAGESPDFHRGETFLEKLA